MNKRKSLRALAKRVKFSATGKVIRRKVGMSHNLSSKARKRKRFLKRQVVMAKPLARKTKLLLPNA